jgi:hypothetical protein
LGYGTWIDKKEIIVGPEKLEFTILSDLLIIKYWECGII